MIFVFKVFYAPFSENFQLDFVHMKEQSFYVINYFCERLFRTLKWLIKLKKKIKEYRNKILKLFIAI